MRTVAIVPARGGSKSIPRKNIKLLAGRPLLWYSAEAARGARRLARTILSTEDEEIARIGRECGLEVPFLRPPDLARDDTPILPVIRHAVRTLESAGETMDAICLLQPTSPLRRSADIDACIHLLETSGADAVATMKPVPAEYNPHWVYFREHGGDMRLCTGEDAPIPRRQDLPPAFHRDGAVYVTRRDVVMCQDSLYGRRLLGYELDTTAGVNLDELDDWTRAEQLIREGVR